VDFEGHVEDPKVKKTLTQLEQQCEQLAVLGSFPMATVSD
jgi:chorismate mutase / prephenate dehydratase